MALEEASVGDLVALECKKSFPMSVEAVTTIGKTLAKISVVYFGPDMTIHREQFSSDVLVPYVAPVAPPTSP